MNAHEALPTWDLDVLFSGLDAPEFLAAWEEAARAVEALALALDAAYGLGDRPEDAEVAAACDAALRACNRARHAHDTVSAWLEARVATNSRDAAAQARLSALQRTRADLHNQGTRLLAWLGARDADALTALSPEAREHAWVLTRARVEASHQLSPAEESLATDLHLSGGSAWSRLYSDFTSQLTVTLDTGEGPAARPMSEVRNLAYDPDREVRRRAWEAERAAWEGASVVVAAALNGVKGEVATLTRRRRWESPLEQSLFEASIDRATLDAMREAAEASFPMFRRYLRAKARALGLPRLAWYDLFAPVGTPSRWPWPDAVAFVIARFREYSPRLGALAERAFSERWVDAAPRPGKQGGAFCMEVRPGESRVLLNYRDAFGVVSTLAHELGHAYHNLCLGPRTPLQRDTPMTLAETASIFCETLVRRAAIRGASGGERLAILEASLQGACQTVVDIASRFRFESNVFQGRIERQLGPDELCALMLAAQEETYGDALDPEARHPFMWAAKPHYYSTSLWFYNYPYTFGHLFALGLYARYEADPEGFREGYDALLSSTGLADAPALASRFGVDLRDPGFWRASLAVLGRDVDDFESLV